MVEIPNREEFEPHLRLRLGAMDKFLESGEFAAKMAWDLIDCHGGVADGIVQKLSINLLFSHKSSCHGDKVCHVRSVRPVDDWQPAAAVMIFDLLERIHLRALPLISFLPKSA